MLTQEDDVEIHALSKRGWSVSAISRHTGRDRKTVRKYLDQPAGQQRPAAPSCLEPFREYLAARFEADKHVDATVLHRELVAAGFDRSYPTLVREIRRLELRPVCVDCQHRRGGDLTVEIDHPAGEEIQWDWLELHQTPWEAPTFVLVGVLSHSGRFRAVFCEQMTFGHLAEAVHRILVALGGTARIWRTDRMATVVIPGSNRLTQEMANLAKHYGVDVSVCPAHRPQRKGVVEAAVKYITRNWWRTAQVTSMTEAQQSLERWEMEVADRRSRAGATVGELGAAEGLVSVPPLAYPALITVDRKVSRSALVAFENNHYSVPPAFLGRTVTVQARIGEQTLKIVSAAGETIASHRRAPAGAGQRVRTAEHKAVLEQAVFAAFTTNNDSCRRKENRPPDPAALAALARLKGVEETPDNVRSLADYQQHADAANLAAVSAR